MKILFITKRQYMGKDLLSDRFGRFYELPKVIAEYGHEVRGVCLSYWAPRTHETAGRPCEQVEWYSYAPGFNWPWGLLKHCLRLPRIAEDFKPNLVVGASDSTQLIIGCWLARRIGVPFVADLYDNFESYGATRIPAMKQLLRRAVRNAAAVSVVSDALAVKIATEYRPRGSMRVISNAIAPEMFRPRDQASARRALGLPPSQLLIGTAGSLSRRRGIETLYGAFERLRRRYDNMMLVLAGPSDRRMTGANVIYLGQMPHRQIPDLYNALDVGVVCIRDDAFGRYCFPQKLYEMLACKLAVVAADVGAAPAIFHENARCLFEPENVESLADAIVYQLNARYRPNISIPTWNDNGKAFEALLRTALEERTAVFERLARPRDSAAMTTDG